MEEIYLYKTILERNERNIKIIMKVNKWYNKLLIGINTGYKSVELEICKDPIEKLHPLWNEEIRESVIDFLKNDKKVELNDKEFEIVKKLMLSIDVSDIYK